MKRLCGYIAIVGVILSVAVSCRRARVIPEDTLSNMYAEMLLCDQWIVSAGLATRADTHFVYKPVFDKYGYTPADFRKTVEAYLMEPEKYAGVFKATKEMLDARFAEIEDEERLLRLRDSAIRADNLRWETIPKPVLYKDILKGLFPSDTVSQGPDSLKYSIVVPVLDTMFAGPALILKPAPDSLRTEDGTGGSGTMVPMLRPVARKTPLPKQL